MRRRKRIHALPRRVLHVFGTLTLPPEIQPWEWDLLMPILAAMSRVTVNEPLSTEVDHGSP